MIDQGVALVTGISSGIGRAIAARLAGNGFRVFGSVRGAPADVPDGVEPIAFDVRDDAAVGTAVESVLARAGRIDALVNNAGGSIRGAIEETDIEQAKALFDVNFFGAARLTRAVLPAMRRQRSGRIVFVSSIVGFLPAPFMGFYSASKHALEGYSESLDHEIRALGIRAILIEPGYMKTKIGQNSARAAHAIEDYAAARERVGAGVDASVSRGDNPELVAKAVERALAHPQPKLRYQVGRGASTLATLRGFVPASLFDRSLRKRFQVDASH